MENTVQVDKAELDQLIQQNADLKVQCGDQLIDLHTICNTFAGLKDLFSGKPSMMKLPAIIGKLMSDQKAMGRLETLGPIIEKYLPKPALPAEININTNGEKE